MARDLAAKVPMYVPRKGLVIGIITESASFTASNKTELDAWIPSEGAPNTWVYETGPAVSDGVEGPAMFNVGRENYVIVDLQTMVIDSVVAGGTAAQARFEMLLPPPPG